MEPTLETGNVLLTDYLSPRFGRVNVGDIVVAKTPKNDYVCKRVVSSSGDRVNYRGRIIPVSCLQFMNIANYANISLAKFAD
jgi:signal peptidase I